MPPLQPLSDDAKERLLHVLSRYREGMCYEFAIAIADATGLPLYGLWSQTESADDGVPGTWRHAFLRVSDKFYFDARGLIQITDLAIFGDTSDIRPVTVEMLAAVRPLTRQNDETIIRFSQAIWPMLPWKQTTYQRRTMAFLTDLEALSQKHQVWIRPPYPSATVMPVLTTESDGSCGYVAQMNDIANITFTRAFK